ncbi:hypothetical protein APHAL10511_006330 [Amanita phalloides]|nr:hypothetical protein APHAL10511_006330 [Amanita phalloides]
MPVPGFLASFADKAQNAINASPLAGMTQQNPDGSLGHKSHAVESISNQLRVISQQYSSTTPLQRIVTAEKSVALDLESLSRDSQYQSKELYNWGHNELDDLKDVTDRLAYLNFVQGSLSGSLSQKLNAARAPLKSLRDAENAMTPRRSLRANLRNQIAKLEHEKGSERKLAELQGLLKKVELDDQAHENEMEILKRKALRESEVAKWDAIREYGEKLILVSQAAASVNAALPAIPPSQANPYSGAQATAAARASLQQALDNYKPGVTSLPSQPTDSDTRSFGESHASELSQIVGLRPSSPDTPPSRTNQPALDKPGPAVNPSSLNQSPAPLPLTTPLDLSQTSTAAPSAIPTVAETGIPVSAGSEGTEPASGSLADLRGKVDTTQKDGSDSTTVPGTVQAFPSAKEEKERLKETYSSQGASPAVVAVTERHETAEEEKKRLEREERERILAGAGSNAQENDDDELPPYQDFNYKQD